MIPGWHPLLVHFPVALTITAAIALLAAKWVRDDRRASALAIVGTWNLFAAAAAALLAIGSGLAALVGLHANAAAHGAIFVHIKWAMVTTTVTMLLAVWRGAATEQEARPSAAFLLLLGIAAAAMAFTAYRGDLNVYRYGVGVRRPPPAAASVASVASSSSQIRR